MAFDPSTNRMQSHRLDGHEFRGVRPHEFSFSAELGHVECSHGKTWQGHNDMVPASRIFLLHALQMLACVLTQVTVYIESDADDQLGCIAGWCSQGGAASYA